MKKKLFYLFAIGLAVIGLTGCDSNSDSSNNVKTAKQKNESTNNNENSNNNSNSTKSKYHSLGETFTFDGLELTFDEEFSIVTVDNMFAEENGQSVIKLGVTVKNVSEEKNSLNMFYYDLFGSKGVELDSVSAYFDESIDFAGELKPGASYKQYFYILYDGNGKYSIDFDNYSQQEYVEFEISI